MKIKFWKNKGQNQRRQNNTQKRIDGYKIESESISNAENISKELKKALFDCRKIIILDNDKVYRETVKEYLFMVYEKMKEKKFILVGCGEEMDKLIKKNRIDKDTLVIMGGMFRRDEKSEKEILGNEYYDKVKKLTEKVYITSGLDKSNFGKRNFMDKMKFVKMITQDFEKA